MRILLADDHALVRESITMFLSRTDPDIETVEVSDFEEAKAVAMKDLPLDVIVLDLMMPAMHGIAGVHEMRALRPDTPIIILSGSFRPDDVMGARKLGAAGFVPKTWGGRRMVEALKIVASGGTYFPDLAGPERPSEIASADVASQPNAQNWFDTQLTARERDVLNLLVKGLPNKLIARELSVAEVTVKVHLQNIFRKLGVNNRTQAVTTAAALGWSR